VTIGSYYDNNYDDPGSYYDYNYNYNDPGSYYDYNYNDA
jgi:hypothetical protein